MYTWHGGFSYCVGIMNTEAIGLLFLTSCTCKPLCGRVYCISLSASYNFVSFTHRDKSALSLCICEICVLRYRYEWPDSLLFVCIGGQTWTLNFVCLPPPTDNVLCLTGLQRRAFRYSLGFHCTFIELVPVTGTIAENAWVVRLLCLLVASLYRRSVCLFGYLSYWPTAWTFKRLLS
jgi:hypothetical protein